MGDLNGRDQFVPGFEEDFPWSNENHFDQQSGYPNQYEEQQFEGNNSQNFQEYPSIQESRRFDDIEFDNCGCGRMEQENIDYGLDSTFQSIHDFDNKSMAYRKDYDMEDDLLMEESFFNNDKECYEFKDQEVSAFQEPCFQNQFNPMNQPFMQNLSTFNNQESFQGFIKGDHSLLTQTRNNALMTEFGDCPSPYQRFSFDDTLKKEALSCPTIYSQSSTEESKKKIGQNNNSDQAEQQVDFIRQRLRKRTAIQDLEEEKVPIQQQNGMLSPYSDPTTTYQNQEQTSLQNDKYYKKFDFFYKRTCFRLFAEFFKDLFNPYHKMWIDNKKKTQMSNLLQTFAQTHFGSLMSEIPANFKSEFLANLMSVVHSHRHNKKEETRLIEGKIDFDLVRDTMYRYSKKCQEKFMQQPVLAFLFIWFSHSQQANEFIQEKFSDKGPEYFERMRQELDELRGEAITWLNKYVVHKSCFKSDLLLRHLSQ